MLVLNYRFSSVIPWLESTVASVGSDSFCPRILHGVYPERLGRRVQDDNPSLCRSEPQRRISLLPITLTAQNESLGSVCQSDLLVWMW